MQRILLAVLAATVGFAGSAQSQQQRPAMPSSRWVLNGHSSAALGTSVGDAFNSIDTHSGLGAGIDYALLAFSRYRSELLRGADRAQATATALDTAGRSVLFAGASVIIALLGLFTLGIAAFQGTVTAVALTVLVTMVASLTLLPALLTLFGGKIEKRVRKHAAKTGRQPGERWRRWALLVQRKPHSIHLIAEGLEQPAQKHLASAAWKRSNPRFKRERYTRKVRLALTAASESRVEPARQHDREK